MINGDEVNQRIHGDDIHVVLVAAESQEDTPKLPLEGEDAEKLVGAIIEATIYLMEEKITEEDFVLGQCHCGTPVVPATVARGYCRGCLKTVTLKIGDPRNDSSVRRNLSGRLRVRQAKDAVTRSSRGG